MSKVSDECPFCERATSGDLIAGSEFAVAFADKFPVSPGHSLIVPIEHVGSIFDLDSSSIADVWVLVAEVKSILKAEFEPDGFNIGVNDGAAAGQTVEHAHVHVIPRFRGDVADPRGGVRWVVHERAPYP